MLKAEKELVNLIILKFNIGMSYDLLSRWNVGLYLLILSLLEHCFKEQWWCLKLSAHTQFLNPSDWQWGAYSLSDGNTMLNKTI